MNFKYPTLSCFILFFCMNADCFETNASDKNTHDGFFSYNPTSINFQNEKVKSYSGLSAMYGTHRIGIGAENVTLFYFPFSAAERITNTELNEYVGMSIKLGSTYYDRYFGFPLSSKTAEAHMKVLYSLGERNSFFEKYPSITGCGTHNLSFGYNGYLTTDSTSQIGGQIDYSYISKKNAWLINYENDTILFYSSDKYRTAAFKITYLRDLGKDVIGLSGGFNIWAGERHIDLVKIWNSGNIQIPEEVDRNETVTLFNGKEYSVDAVFISFIFNNFSLSVGYDSELFKQVIHNNIHYILDDGKLPILERNDRVYIEFKIGLIDDLF